MRSHLDGPLLEMKLRDAGLGAGGGELLLLELPLDAGQAAGQRAGLRLIHHLRAGGGGAEKTDKHETGASDGQRWRKLEFGNSTRNCVRRYRHEG